MIILTALSIVTCLAGQDATKGECRNDIYVGESWNYTEASEDWEACLAERDKLQLKYHSVECDQWEKGLPPPGMEKADAR